MMGALVGGGSCACNGNEQTASNDRRRSLKRIDESTRKLRFLFTKATRMIFPKCMCFSIGMNGLCSAGFGGVPRTWCILVVGKNGKFGKFCDLRRILEIFGSCVRWRVLEFGESREVGVRFPCSGCPFPN